MSQIILLNKPFGVLCQFHSDDRRPTLADLVKQPDVYPAGRLDHDSEGLVLLTSDGALQARISHPRHKLKKTYLVQVEGLIDKPALAQLRQGVILNDGTTRPASAKRITTPDLWQRDPPIRYRKNIPTSWIELTITEGRNRQVRRMTAAVGFPTLRLVRIGIGNWRLHPLQPGESRLEEVYTPRQNLRPKTGSNSRNRNARSNTSHRGQRRRS